MAEARSDKSEVQRAIAEHFASHGPVRWDKVRERFPDVPIATFWRWVRAVKTKPSLERMRAARDLLATSPGTLVACGAPLLAPALVGAVTADGAGATRQVNVRQEFDELVADAKLLRAFSMSPDGSKVRVPKIFADAAKLRIQLVQMVI